MHYKGLKAMPIWEKNYKFKGQLEFDIDKPFEKDRNHQQGGRSFYFFDFDENIAFLNTSTVIFHKKTNQTKNLTGKEFSIFQKDIGVKGLYKDYKIEPNDETGSFRNYRDQKIPKFLELLGKKQSFISDLALTIKSADRAWQGPSWSCFYHAVYNKRPIALITARGHSPETIREGIKQLVKHNLLPYEPNYLGIYPVNHPETKAALIGDETTKDVSFLKKLAIKDAYNKAIEIYGDKPHRFGMSDDCRFNIETITEAMQELKTENPKVSFFVIETSGGKYIKKELSPLSPTVAPVKTKQLEFTETSTS